jgi:hypothetical protein
MRGNDAIAIAEQRSSSTNAMSPSNFGSQGQSSGDINFLDNFTFTATISQCSSHASQSVQAASGETPTF